MSKIATKLADILSTFMELCFAGCQTKCINGPEITCLASKLDDEHDFGLGLVHHGSTGKISTDAPKMSEQPNSPLVYLGGCMHNY
jgi:hypothetical protein